MTKNIIKCALLIMLPLSAAAQSYKDSILQYQQHYKGEFMTDARSPLKGDDTAFLHFYAPDSHYRVLADFKRTADSKSFMIPTHSGKNKEYKQYGIVTFKIKKTPLTLHIYQSVNQTTDYLFIPFTDETNYTETYGGGRYLEVAPDDIKDGNVWLDFNKCYNPYCAFASGYSCPIPPDENKLHVAIKAGEKLYGKKVSE